MKIRESILLFILGAGGGCKRQYSNSELIYYLYDQGYKCNSCQLVLGKGQAELIQKTMLCEIIWIVRHQLFEEEKKKYMISPFLYKDQSDQSACKE